jgi:hypothetical protein
MSRSICGRHRRVADSRGDGLERAAKNPGSKIRRSMPSFGSTKRPNMASTAGSGRWCLRIAAAARDRFYRSFDLVENEHPLNIADSWNVIHLQPRGTFHAPSVDRHAFEMRAPHTDNKLVDQQRPIEPNFAKEYVSMVGSYALRKLGAPLERLRARPALGREFRDLNEHFRREPELADRVLRPLLRDSVLPASVFSHEGVERVIAEHYSGAAGYHDTLALLVSWGLAAKYFLHDDLSDVPPKMHVP